MIRCAVWLLAVAVGSGCVIVVPGGAGGGSAAAKVYCVKDKASGACSCDLTDPGLSADTEYVSNCDSLPADTQCCHDVNGDGESTTCFCERALCVTDTDTDKCECRYFGSLIIGNTRDNEKIVSQCPTTACCLGKTCQCYGPNCFSDKPVASCALADIPAKRTCEGGTKWAANCAGLKWKSK